MPNSTIKKHSISETKGSVVPIQNHFNTLNEEQVVDHESPDHERFRLAGNSSEIKLLTIISLMRVLDILVVMVLGFVISYSYVGLFTPTQELSYQIVIVSTSIFTAILFESFKLYPSHRIPTSPKDLLRLWQAWTLMIILVVLIAFFTKASAGFSRVWLMSWYLSAGALLVLLRVCASYISQNMMKSGSLSQNIIIIGDKINAEQVASNLLKEENDGLRIHGIFYDNDEPQSLPSTEGLTRGTLQGLIAFAKDTPIDCAIIALPFSARQRFEKISKMLELFPIDIRVAAHTDILHISPKACSFVGGLPVFNISDKPISGGNFVLKLLFDKIIATLMIIALAPVMMLVALAIRLEGGRTILFKQKRIGFNNELIEIFKFRSMHEEQADHNANKLVTRDDPRVTKVGHFIRKTSLDELPQLFNVLRGDLSLVGPRPHATQAKADGDLYGNVVDNYFTRHRVKPGITGWAQVNGWRGETDTYEKIKKRVEHDLYYVENWSLLFDIRILLQTPLELFNDKQAY